MSSRSAAMPWPVVLPVSAWVGGRMTPEPPLQVPEVPPGLHEQSDALFDLEALTPPRIKPRKRPYRRPPAFSLEWFLEIERRRYSGPGQWLPTLLQFDRHEGETVLVVGNAGGTDATRFARHGSRVVVSHPKQAELSLVRRNFALRGLPGRFLHAAPTHLPLPDACVDVAYLAEVFCESPQPAAVAKEVFRVLRPGGKIVAVELARPRSWPFWWQRRPDQARGLRARDFRRIVPQYIEATLFRRHVRRRTVFWAWRCFPRMWLERLLGHYWILRAYKPVSASSLAAIRLVA